jgi:hypothetical protein
MQRETLAEQFFDLLYIRHQLKPDNCAKKYILLSFDSIEYQQISYMYAQRSRQR